MVIRKPPSLAHKCQGASAFDRKRTLSQPLEKVFSVLANRAATARILTRVAFAIGYTTIWFGGTILIAIDETKDLVREHEERQAREADQQKAEQRKRWRAGSLASWKREDERRSLEQALQRAKDNHDKALQREVDRLRLRARSQGFIDTEP